MNISCRCGLTSFKTRHLPAFASLLLNPEVHSQLLLLLSPMWMLMLSGLCQRQGQAAGLTMQRCLVVLWWWKEVAGWSVLCARWLRTLSPTCLLALPQPLDHSL